MNCREKTLHSAHERFYYGMLPIEGDPGLRVFISAGEASGDLYASRVVEALRARHPDIEFFGCAGPRMQAAGVRAIVDSRSIAVAGLVEVVAHIPRIWGEFRKLCRAIALEKPDVAVLTDSPDFHLRLAKRSATARRSRGLSDRSAGLGLAAGTSPNHARDHRPSSLYLPL